MATKQRKSMADVLAAAARKQLATPDYDEAVASIERITSDVELLQKKNAEGEPRQEKTSIQQEDTKPIRRTYPTPLPDTTTQHHNPTPEADTSPPQSLLVPMPMEPKKEAPAGAKKAVLSHKAGAKKPSRPRSSRKLKALLLDESLKNLIPHRPKIAGEQQVELYEWLKAQGGRVYATGRVISEETRIPLRSLRRIFQRWEEMGVLEKQADVHGSALVLLIDDKEAYGKRKDAALPDTKSLLQDAVSEQNPPPFEVLYPLLTAAGFGALQFKNAVEAARQAGLETEPFPRYLAYAEYELEQGCMVDGKGEPVTTPPNWVFKCLRSGSYRVPKGYISPIERQRRELEEALQHDLEERKKLAALQAQELDLALDKETDRLTQLVLEVDDAFSRQMIKSLPPFLHKLDKDSPIFRSGIKREIRARLTAEAHGKSQGKE